MCDVQQISLFNCRTDHFVAFLWENSEPKAGGVPLFFINIILRYTYCSVIVKFSSSF